MFTIMQFLYLEEKRILKHVLFHGSQASEMEEPLQLGMAGYLTYKLSF